MERMRTDRTPGDVAYQQRQTSKQSGTFCLMVNAEAGRVRTEGAEKVVDDVSSCFEQMDIPLEVI